jgi:hypothetical protein
MPKALTVELTEEQKQELRRVRDHHSKAYVRVKAAAILKVADGQSRRHLALYGLLKPMAQETVSQWIKR